ncbi:MAG: restriction endonuclease [Chloroflexota bacterium]
MDNVRFHDTKKRGRSQHPQGVDSVLNFVDDPKQGKLQRVLIQVKSEHVKSDDIRDLRGLVERDEAALGVFITFEEPTRDMLTEAASSGFIIPPSGTRTTPASKS